MGALRVSKYQFRKASQGFTFLKIYKPSSCTSAMFFYPAKMDAGNSECFRRAACQNQRRNTQGPSETGEIANARVELLVGLHTTDSPLPGKIKEDGSHMGRTDAFFTDTFKILATSWFGVLEEALPDLSFWWKVCLPLSGTGTKSSMSSLIAENSYSMRRDDLNQPYHGSVGVESDDQTTHLSSSTTTQLFSLVGTPCPPRSTQMMHSCLGCGKVALQLAAQILSHPWLIKCLLGDLNTKASNLLKCNSEKKRVLAFLPPSKA